MSDRVRRPLAHAKRLLVALCSASIGLIAAEGLLRLAFPQPASWLAIYRRHPRLQTFALLPDHHAVIETGETRWEVSTDARGLRVGIAPPDSTRGEVLWLGDSFPFGHGVDYEQTWIHLLHTDGTARHRARLAAVPGYGPLQYEAALRDELEHAPEPRYVVVCTFLGNDFHDTMWGKDVPVHDATLGATPGLRGWVKRNTHAYRLLARVYHVLGSRSRMGSPAELDQAASWSEPFLREARERYTAAFGSIAAICAERELHLRLVVIPTVEMVAAVKRGGMPQDFAPVDPRNGLLHARRILDQLGLVYVDLTSELAREEPATMYFTLDGHFTPAGHRVVRAAISQAFPELP